jgi:hypothetical protein
MEQLMSGGGCSNSSFGTTETWLGRLGCWVIHMKCRWLKEECKMYWWRMLNLFAPDFDI